MHLSVGIRDINSESRPRQIWQDDQLSMDWDLFLRCRDPAIPSRPSKQRTSCIFHKLPSFIASSSQHCAIRKSPWGHQTPPILSNSSRSDKSTPLSLFAPHLPIPSSPTMSLTLAVMIHHKHNTSFPVSTHKAKCNTKLRLPKKIHP